MALRYHLKVARELLKQGIIDEVDFDFIRDGLVAAIMSYVEFFERTKRKVYVLR